MNRTDAIRKLTDYYTAVRSRESDALLRREEEVRGKIPEIDDLLRERVMLPIRAIKSMMGDKSHAAQMAETMKNEGLRINAAIRTALVNNGYSEDYLNLRYECPICKDTGYVGDKIPPETCECFTKKLREIMNEDRDDEPACASFADFNENLIPEEPLDGTLTQRMLTVRIKEACEDYANDYPKTYLPNLFLSGQAGLGKTFLLGCIKSRIEERGFEVRYVTAYKMLEICRSRHFHEEDSGEEFNELLTCPLLIIDDLGSEPILRNISAEYLCQILSERVNRGLHTIVSTNLTLPQFKELYDERVMSRLSDRRAWDHLRLMGKDLRRA